MITRRDMMNELLAACPSFEPGWREFQAEWQNEPEPPLYCAFGDLARHLIAMLQRGESRQLEAAFAAVERLHTDGDNWVREAATIGLLETLQNNCEHQGLSPDSFRPLLGPESEVWWDRLNRFWDGDFTALHE